VTTGALSPLAIARAEGRHGYTYSAHPTCCAVGLANLDIIEREGLIDRVSELEPVLAGRLKPLPPPGGDGPPARSNKR
jgi:adenosylmethionine-8-amino-7-oxononanoate aminotransferase